MLGLGQRDGTWMGVPESPPRSFLTFSGASPILTEKQAKQLLRSRRHDRPSKPGFPDELMRVSSRQALGCLKGQGGGWSACSL